MASSTVRVSAPTHRTLRELSEQSGEPMQGILEKAIEDYRRKSILERANAAYAALRADVDAWEEELAERAHWDAALSEVTDATMAQVEDRLRILLGL